MRRLMSGIASVVVGSVLMAGCGSAGQPQVEQSRPSVEQSREDAYRRLEGLIFADQPKVRRQIAEATTPEGVAAAMSAAEADDQESGVRYWGCAAKAAALLEDSGGSTWWGGSVAANGKELVDVELRLSGDGAAELRELRRPEMMGAGEVTPDPGDVWVTGHVGLVSGWSSNASQLVAERRWVGDQGTPSFAGAAACELPFTLTLVTGEGPQELSAKIKLSANDPILFISGLGLTHRKQ